MMIIDKIHQCGWCGEYFTGSRVDHGCPVPPISESELTPTDLAQMSARTEETQRQDDYDSASEGHP